MTIIESKDKENDVELIEAVTNLKTIIDAVEQAGIIANEALKVELEIIEAGLKTEIETLKQALKEAIEEAAKENAELEEKLLNVNKTTKEELLSEIKLSIIFPTVIGIISLVGNIGLVVYILMKRKK